MGGLAPTSSHHHSDGLYRELHQYGQISKGLFLATFAEEMNTVYSVDAGGRVVKGCNARPCYGRMTIVLLNLGKVLFTQPTAALSLQSDSALHTRLFICESEQRDSP